MNPIQQFMSTLNRASVFIPLVLRVVVGYIFVRHGYQKFDWGLDTIEAGFDEMGVPVPALSSRFAAVAELVGGAALIVGFASRLFAVALSIVMIGAFIYVSKDMPLLGASEINFALLVSLLAIVFIGPGRISVDALVGIEPKESQITV